MFSFEVENVRANDGSRKTRWSFLHRAKKVKFHGSELKYRMELKIGDILLKDG